MLCGQTLSHAVIPLQVQTRNKKHKSNMFPNALSAVITFDKF